MKFLSKLLIAGFVFGQFAGTANAADESIGKLEYLSSCAACHGLEGTGDGSFSAFLDMEMPDLTQLAKNNGGAFPANRVYGVIDGRDEIAAHGERYMTIWGSRYSAESIQELEPFGMIDIESIERMVRGRILELSFFLLSIQE